MAVGNNLLYPDPWEALDGTEIFWDNFSSFAGWTSYSGVDTTTTPTIDTTASIMRAKGDNPCIDATTRTNGLIIMPEHTASGSLSIARAINSVLTPTGNWTIVSRVHLPVQAVIVNNSAAMSMGLSLPASNSLVYNSASVDALEIDSAENAFQYTYYTNGAVTTSEYVTLATVHPASVWLFLFHVSGESTITAAVSYDSGRSLCEIGTISKSPTGFTTLYFTIIGVKQMVTYHQFGIDYVRVYQSITQR
jgi:hypothetical protein